jgi:hypothetical protein
MKKHLFKVETLEKRPYSLLGLFAGWGVFGAQSFPAYVPRRIWEKADDGAGVMPSCNTFFIHYQ